MSRKGMPYSNGTVCAWQSPIQLAYRTCQSTHRYGELAVDTSQTDKEHKGIYHPIGWKGLFLDRFHKGFNLTGVPVIDVGTVIVLREVTPVTSTSFSVG